MEQAGIEYTIFERESQHEFYNRPRDWGMLLHWGQEYLTKLLPAHLVPRLRETRCDPEITEDEVSLHGVPYVDAFTGDLIAEIPMQGVNRVSRMKLRRFLTDGQNLNIKVSSVQRPEYFELNSDIMVVAHSLRGLSCI